METRNFAVFAISFPHSAERQTLQIFLQCQSAGAVAGGFGFAQQLNRFQRRRQQRLGHTACTDRPGGNTVDGYNAIQIEGARLAIHETKCSKKIDKVQVIKFKERFFNGKKVLLFDDILTRGFSYARFACELESFGAEVVGGYFLGRTLIR